MITELINFTKDLSEDFKSLGLTPKEGLHIILTVDASGAIDTSTNSVKYAYYSKKMKELNDVLDICKKLQEHSWCINTNKCFDPKKGIHTCSPMAIAFKKEHMEGGEKYKINIQKENPQIQERFDVYFGKTKSMWIADELFIKTVGNLKKIFIDKYWKVILEEIESQRATIYQSLLEKEGGIKEQFKNTLEKPEKEHLKEKLQNIQEGLLEVQPLMDSDYILFFLDLPLKYYKETHAKYLDDNLFNTSDYNTVADENGFIYGTNDFQNGFNAKMPFLLHHTASFDITGRISNLAARALYEFSNVLPRKTLPNPLPIFIYSDEFKEKVIALYKERRMSFRDLVETLYHTYKDDFQNYYLLQWANTQNGIFFNDYDFVAKFEYELKPPSGLEILNYFNLYEDKKPKHYAPIKTIFQLEDRVLKYLIQNKYHRVDYFADFKKEDYDNRDMSFLSFCKYRKSVYDYVYKSNRNTIKGQQFDEMVFNGIKDDFKSNNEYGIKEKLNYWYSLYEHFHEQNTKERMGSKLKEYQELVAQIAIGEGDFEKINDKHFAFAAGQVIEYLIDKSASDKKNYQLLEPYLQKSKCDELKQAIANDIARYKHAIDFNEFRFKNVVGFVETWETDKNIKDFLPELISGIFSKTQFFTLEFNKNKND